MLACQQRGADHLRLRQQPPRPGGRPAGHDRAPSRFRGFVPPYIRPLFCEGNGPFRWAALSGDPRRYRRDRPGRAGAVSGTTRTCSRWMIAARQRSHFQGLPARICWLGYGERAGWACASTDRAQGQSGGPHRDRPRPPRFRLGGLAQPRDRRHEGRLRRDRRLADPERAGERRQRRQLGERSITAAASASAIDRTPAWSAWPTARPWPRSACIAF